MTADERERAAGDRTQRTGDRARRQRRRGEVAAECLRGDVRRGLRERGRDRPRDASANATSSQRLTSRSPRAARRRYRSPTADSAQRAELGEQRVDRALAARVWREARRATPDRTRPAVDLPSARATTPLFAARGTKSATSRAIRRASVGAPIATRSPSAASITSIGALAMSRPQRAIATCSSRPGSVSSTRHSSSMPRRHSPAAMQRARRGEPRDRTVVAAAEAELRPRERHLVFAAERDERVEEDREIDRVAGLDRDRSPRRRAPRRRGSSPRARSSTRRTAGPCASCARMPRVVRPRRPRDPRADSRAARSLRRAGRR